MNVQTNFKNPILRDSSWLARIKRQEVPCAITGRCGDENDHVVPAHIGTAGKGIKSPDNEVIPMLSVLHQASHGQANSGGDVTFWCDVFKKDPHLMRDVLRAYAREVYSSNVGAEIAREDVPLDVSAALNASEHLCNFAAIGGQKILKQYLPEIREVSDLLSDLVVKLES